MKLTEKIAAIVFVLALIMRFFFIPGGGILIALCLNVLAIIYFYFGFLLFNNIRLRYIFKSKAYKTTSVLQILTSILIGFSLSILIIGIMFKIMHWPDPKIMIYIGLLLTIPSIILVLFRHFKEKSSTTKNILIRYGIILIYLTLLMSIPERKIIEVKYRNHPKFIEAYDNLQKDPNNVYLDSLLIKESNRITLRAEEFEYYYKEPK